MKKHPAAAAALGAVLLLSLLSGCGGAKAELALVTDSGAVDDGSRNQGAWEGVVRYAEENKLTSQNYQPASADTQGYLAAIDLAVDDGAQTIVVPGASFADALETAQQTYSDVNFIALDCVPAQIAENTLSVLYAEEQAGYLAGYAAVKEGYRSIGYIGGEQEDAVVRYGFGFVQGAEHAAQEMELEAGAVQLRYAEFSPSPADTAKAWYAGGVECIFAAGGSAVDDVARTAEQQGGVLIASDVDSAASSDAVLVSAIKNRSASVYSMLSEIYRGRFEGGREVVLGCAENGVALSMDTARFKTFRQEEYDAVLTRLQSDADGIASSIVREPAGSGSLADSGVVTELIEVLEVR